MSKVFSVVSDPRMLYLTEALNNAIKRVDYVITKRQGLTAIVGDNGLGKTSVLRLIHWKYVDNPDYIVGMISTPNFATDFAMLKYISNEFGVPAKRSLHDQQVALTDWLVEQYKNGKNVVVFIDEAQKLSNKELELIRVFLNSESYDDKLIQVVLVGQLELREKLLRKENKALYSRLFYQSILSPLTLDETVAMIEHRCNIEKVLNSFTPAQIEEIYQVSKGVPRDAIKHCVYLMEQDVPPKYENEKLEVENEQTHNVKRHATSKVRRKQAKSTS